MPFVWERPFWAGDHPCGGPSISPLHRRPCRSIPRRLVETANDSWLGFRYIGAGTGGLDPAGIEVWRFGSTATARHRRPHRIP